MTQSIQARFGFSLVANLLKAAITFGTGLLVARSLGPEQYGTMMFLLGTFVAVRQLLDMGSSTAFFTFLSQRQRSRRFVFWYFGLLGLQFVIPLLAVGMLFPDAWIELIWKGEQRALVILAFLAAYMQSVLWTIVVKMGESQRLTHWVQGVGVVVAGIHLILIFIALWGSWLVVRSIFLLMIFEWMIAAVVILTQLRFQAVQEESETLKAVFLEFWRYCLPLIPYAWLSFVYEFADRWLLQTYSGSVQQAYYAVAYQFGAVAAIATSSILNIFWKEIAEAHQQDNQKRVALLYRKVSRGLFFISASVAGFFVPWAAEILRFTLGPAYVAGAPVLAIMLLYPLHQVMGQIGGSMLYATNRVGAQVVIGMLFMLSSVLVSYFVLAPATALIPGFDLESIGLAWKMVVMQFLGVNAVALYLARSMRVRYDWTYQPICGFGCLAAGYLAYFIPLWFIIDEPNVWMSMLVSAMFYSVMILIALLLFPSLAGVTREEIFGVFRRL